jgi:hypothetical protein
MNMLFRNLLTSAFVVGLMAIALPGAARAEQNNQATYNYNPFQLVFLAEQGAFTINNIPTYDALPLAYENKQLKGSELVRVAVDNRYLPKSVLSDQSYINAVDNHLANWTIYD